MSSEDNALLSLLKRKDVWKTYPNGPKIAPLTPKENDMKESIKREDLSKSEQSQPKDDQVYERRERGAKGDPAPEDFSAGEYHGLTPQQIKKIEDARYDDTDGITTVDGAGKQADEQQKRLEEQEKEEKARLAKEKADREKAEKEADHGKVNKRA